MPNRDTVKAFIALVELGQYVEAIEAYYSEDASMQENMLPPRRGRATLVEGERQVLASVRQIRTRPVETYFVEGDRVVINWIFDFELPDGSTFSQNELALQRWVGDKIVEERFYYDPAQRQPKPAKSAA